MDIATGLGIAKTSVDLIKGIREALKKKTLSNEEILAYFADLQDRIVDLKTALADADDETRTLKRELEEQKRATDFGGQLKPMDGVYWHDDYAYCPACWDADRKPVRLGGPVNVIDRGQFKAWTCPIHKVEYRTPKR